MREALTINSHKGPYVVHFVEDVLSTPRSLAEGDQHVIIDANVARIYKSDLQSVLSHPNTIILEATEDAKSLQRIIPVIDLLVQHKIRRTHHLVAIGGGVIQDITCFIASILLRGIDWHFVPTTLLAQADSCIGSKSSINLESSKNIVGTFYPPRTVWVDASFLASLGDSELRSGIGEILKVHAIDSMESFDDVAANYESMLSDPMVLRKYIRESLLIKKRFIEIDEFDTGIRNIFNFGHSFGHAIETVTNFGVPHGIAVTMGMDIACQISHARGSLPTQHLNRMREHLRKNYLQFINVNIPVDGTLNALLKDKKNTTTMLGLILPVGDRSVIKRVDIPPDEIFREQLAAAVLSLA
ncbi:MAG: AroB-related putative sugar phosphate phospholyase (cyclizing) [Ilumatobacteraceae bacterium]